jgi:intracellular multiplication protein IcmP
MSSGGGPQSQTLHDTAMGWAILLVVAFFLFILFWYYNAEKVKDGFRWLRWSEMWVISKVVGDDYAVPWTDKKTGRTQKIRINGPNGALEYTRNLRSYDLDKQNMHAIGTVTMAPMKIPIMVILGIFALWSVTSGPGTQFRRKFNIDGLLGAQANNFPIIAPLIKFNPAKQPPRPPGAPVPASLPPFAEALGPEEWLAYNQIPIPDGDIDENAAYMAFAKQLGGRWKGALNLPVHKQILLAAFCLKASRSRDEADVMLGELANCWSHDNGFQLRKNRKLLPRARKILKDKDKAGSMLAKTNQHAFQNCAMIRALATAREEGGVLAPSQFLWLRAYDRALWYPLNNLGRQAFHMEALGAMSHYRAEKLTGRPIPKPKLNDAIESISEYMNSPQARPIPQLDYSKSKRKGIKKPKSAGVKKPKTAKTVKTKKAKKAKKKA